MPHEFFDQTGYKMVTCGLRRFGQIKWVCTAGILALCGCSLVQSGCKSTGPDEDARRKELKAESERPHFDVERPPSAQETSIAMSEWSLSMVALACPCAGIDERAFGGTPRPNFDTPDKPRAITEFIRSAKGSSAPTVSQREYLSYWANPKIEAALSLDDLPATELLFESMVVTFIRPSGSVTVDHYRMGRTSLMMFRSTKELTMATTLNQYGLWVSSEVYRNIGTLDAPVAGDLVRSYHTTVSDDTRDMSGTNYEYQAQQIDAVTHQERTLVFDNQNSFRKIGSRYIAHVRNTDQALTVDTRYFYSENFASSTLPSLIQISVNGKTVAEGKSVSFDSDARAHVLSIHPAAGGPDTLKTFRLDEVE